MERSGDLARLGGVVDQLEMSSENVHDALWVEGACLHEPPLAKTLFFGGAEMGP